MEYLKKLKIQIHPDKMQAIINKSSKRLPRYQLVIGNNKINVVNEVKYLGVVLDKKLLFKSHINESNKSPQSSLAAVKHTVKIKIQKQKFTFYKRYKVNFNIRLPHLTSLYQRNHLL